MREEQGQAVTVADMAQAREARAARQAELAGGRGVNLVCLTINVAGPIKTNALILRAFHIGAQRLRDTLAAHRLEIEYYEERLLITGPEGYFCVDADAPRLKRLAVGIEEMDALGRLLDIDVLDVDGDKTSRESLGFHPRRCLLCGSPAAPCAASRAHPAQELFDKAMRIIREHLDSAFADHAASLAVRSLLYELAVTPKPGLVDRAGSGVHTDMDFFTFLRSAPALFPYFRTCAALGQKHGATAETFAHLRAAGAVAEGDMLRATGGVNTHQGAIFTLGILCAAAGGLHDASNENNPQSLSTACANMTAQSLENERLASLETKQLAAHPPRTYGESLQTDRLAGARAEAAAGFPSALTGLRVLEKSIAEGININDASLHALLAIIATAEDTVLLRRVGPQTAIKLQSKAQDLLNRKAPISEINALCDTFMHLHASPGGSADLLAASFFFYMLNEIPQD